jgi:hypothetical protein
MWAAVFIKQYAFAYRVASLAAKGLDSSGVAAVWRIAHDFSIAFVQFSYSPSSKNAALRFEKYLGSIPPSSPSVRAAYVGEQPLSVSETAQTGIKGNERTFS